MNKPDLYNNFTQKPWKEILVNVLICLALIIVMVVINFTFSGLTALAFVIGVFIGFMFAVNLVAMLLAYEKQEREDS